MPTNHELFELLWQTVIEAARPMQIAGGCHGEIEPVVRAGVERMIAENRTSPEDVALARENLQRLVAVMVHHANVMGFTELHEPTALASMRLLEVAKFELWPFWPPFWQQTTTVESQQSLVH